MAGGGVKILWEYNYNYLCHAIRKNTEWDEHKYIDKVKTKNGRYRYIYELPSKQITSKKTSIGSGTGLLAKRLPSLPELVGIYTIDLKADDKINKSYRALKQENIEAENDNYDDIYSISDMASYVKEYFYELYKFEGLKPDKSWAKDVKAMKQYLIDYYHVLPWKFNNYSDEEIVCMFMMLTLKESGYDESKLSLSHYLQNLGMVNEKKVLKDSGIKNIDELKKTNPVADDLDMEYINHDNLDELALSQYQEYPNEAGLGYTSNCAYCTLAYELRQRGYDVEASSVSWETANTIDIIGTWYKDKKTGQTSSFTHASNTRLKNWDSVLEKVMLSDVDSLNNARGQFCVTWRNGGGHSMVYEVVNGQVQIRDCQINKKYALKDWILQYELYVEDAYVLRTDNKNISEDALVGVRNRR